MDLSLQCIFDRKTRRNLFHPTPVNIVSFLCIWINISDGRRAKERKISYSRIRKRRRNCITLYSSEETRRKRVSKCSFS
jgi:hypothetical protein